MKDLYKILFAICIALFAANAQAKPEKYVFDKEHTTIIFTVDHLGFSNKIGYFEDFDGYFIFDKDKPENSSVEVNIKPASIDSLSKGLDKVLQDDDWFDSKNHPIVTFKSSSVEVTGKDTADVKGWLTIRGIQKRSELKVKFNKAEINPVTDEFTAGFSADSEVKRTLYGMKKYIPWVGEFVKIHIEAEGVKEKPKSK